MIVLCVTTIQPKNLINISLEACIPYVQSLTHTHVIHVQAIILVLSASFYKHKFMSYENNPSHQAHLSLAIGYSEIASQQYRPPQAHDWRTSGYSPLGKNYQPMVPVCECVCVEISSIPVRSRNKKRPRPKLRPAFHACPFYVQRYVAAK